MSENGKNYLVIALIAGFSSIFSAGAGAFIGVWGGREVASAEMRGMREATAANTLAIGKNAEQIERLTATVSMLQASVATIQALQVGGLDRIKRIEQQMDEVRRGQR